MASIDGETRRINDETKKDTSVHTKKLEIGLDQRVEDLKSRLADLEKCIEEVEKDKLNETEMKQFEIKWQHLIDENTVLVDERMKLVDSKINEAIRRAVKMLSQEDGLQLEAIDWSDLFKTPVVFEMPQVTENDIIQKEDTKTRLGMDFVNSKSHVNTAKSSLHDAQRKWDLQFQDQRDLEFYVEEILLEVGRLLGILAEEHYEVRPGADEICTSLPPGYSFTRDYINRFIKFACHYSYKRSIENIWRFILMTDPLADIVDRCAKSISQYRQRIVEENANAVCRQIFDYAKSSFVRDLGELIKAEVCKEDNKNSSFKSKRAFLGTILIELGQKTHNLTHTNEEKEKIFKDFMLYVQMAESEASKNFFLDVILQLLKEILTRENASETDFQKMVRNNVGRVVEKAKKALRQAETKCKESLSEYVRIFKDYMNVVSEIDFTINILPGFTDAVLEKIDSLYVDFLRKANSSFETLVCEENKAAIRTMFEKIMGCREKCPFCSAPCSQSLQQHAGDHCANHYPMGVSGTVDCWGFFTNTQETHDATKEEQRKPKNLAMDTCQTMVGTSADIRTKATKEKYTKWYHRLFNWNYHSFKNYREVAEYETWDIPYSRDDNTSLYWKWFMAQFAEELAKYYEALDPKIPETWKKMTWEEAKESLNSQFGVEE